MHCYEQISAETPSEELNKKEKTMSTTANNNHKDTLFKTLFGKNKENALSLYNAINGTNYTESENFEYTTMEDVLYMKMKDDVSFLVGISLNLYEHQSTYNPNMPLRGLFYFAALYRKMIEENERLYSTTLLKIPNPKFIVFYNGISTQEKPDMEKLRLSDAFFERDDTGEFEWTATMININVGHNRELFEKCQVLKHYSIFIHRVREYNNSTNDLTKAINKAADECIKEGILKEILEKQKKEGYDMVLTEFDEEKYEALIRAEGMMKTLCSLVYKKDLTLKKALEECNLTETEFLEKMKEFGFETSK